jgi:hypothetical protein
VKLEHVAFWNQDKNSNDQWLENLSWKDLEIYPKLQIGWNPPKRNELEDAALPKHSPSSNGEVRLRCCCPTVPLAPTFYTRCMPCSAHACSCCDCSPTNLARGPFHQPTLTGALLHCVDRMLYRQLRLVQQYHARRSTPTNGSCFYNGLCFRYLFLVLGCAVSELLKSRLTCS